MECPYTSMVAFFKNSGFEVSAIPKKDGTPFLRKVVINGIECDLRYCKKLVQIGGIFHAPVFLTVSELSVGRMLVVYLNAPAHEIEFLVIPHSEVLRTTGATCPYKRLNFRVDKRVKKAWQHKPLDLDLYRNAFHLLQ